MYNNVRVFKGLVCPDRQQSQICNERGSRDPARINFDVAPLRIAVNGICVMGYSELACAITSATVARQMRPSDIVSEVIIAVDDSRAIQNSISSLLGFRLSWVFMGIDFLDIIFRLEKAFGVKIPRDDLVRFLEARGKKLGRRDFSVSDLFDFMQSRLPPVDTGDAVARNRKCVVCSYNLRGLPLSGNCPECGAAASFHGQIQAGINQVLVDALGVKPEEIRSDSTLVKDLGMT